jgi:methionyl-tRNA formyltransferase
MRILFFGSTSDSVLVLEKLPLTEIIGVVTQPPKPVGREKTITPTPVELWAKQRNITVLSFPSNPVKPWVYENEQTVIAALQPLQADLVISASYGQKIPCDGVNVHPSLLPRWRGADPVPWAILSGDHQTGVSIVQLSKAFDQGLILAQEKVNISDSDTTDPLRAKLFSQGADLLIKNLPDILSKKIKGTPQKIEGEPYARRLKREDGFEPWEKLMNPKEAVRIDRKFRAFDPWPGLWCLFQNKRLKILEVYLKEKLLGIQTVQLEGKTPVSWEQFKKAYLSS